MLEDDSKVDEAPAPNLGWRHCACWLHQCNKWCVFCQVGLQLPIFSLGKPIFGCCWGLGLTTNCGTGDCDCIKRRGCTSLQFSVHMAMIIEVVICLTPDIKRRQNAWQKEKHIMEALWFQLLCIIKVIHNQKCYCFKVSLPAYTLPHIKKVISSCLIFTSSYFFLIPSQNIMYLLLFFLAPSLFRYCIKCNME